MPNQISRLFTPAPLSESLKVYLSANAFLRATGMGRGILLAWLMINQREFGIYQIGMVLVNALFPLLSLGLQEAIVRHVPEFEAKGQLWRYLRWAMPFCLVLGLGLCGILFVAASPTSVILFGSDSTLDTIGTVEGSAGYERVRLTRCVALCVAVLVAYHLVSAILRGRRMFRAVSLMELSAGLLFTIFALLTALLGRGSGLAIIMIYTAANLITAILFGIPTMWYVIRHPATKLHADASRFLPRLLKYGIGVGLAACSWQILLLFPAYYLNRACGEEALATYRAITIFSQFGYILPAAVSIALASAVTVTWETVGREKALAKLDLASRATIAAVIVLCLIIAMLKDVLMMAFPPEYGDGSHAIPLLLLFFTAAGALSMLTIRFALIEKSSLTLLSWLCGWIVAVLFCLAFVSGDDPARALLMTAWANVLGLLAALSVAIFLLHRRGLLPDRRFLFLAAFMFLFLTSWPLWLAGALALVLLSLKSNMIFDGAERKLLFDRTVSFLRVKSIVTHPERSDNGADS